MAKTKRSRQSSTAESAPETNRSSTDSSLVATKTVDFATEYYYVYTEIRNVTMVAVAMFVVLFGLSYIIH